MLEKTVGSRGSSRALTLKVSLGAAATATMAVLSLGAAHSVQAVTTRLATTSSARDFLAGEAKGTAVTSEGRLVLGLPIGERTWPETAADAVVFAAAADSAGRVYIATGGGLGRLFVSEPDGRLALRFTAPESNLTAVAVAPDGALLCASSPNGKVYRFDARQIEKASAGTQTYDSGASSVWADPKEAAIWSLAFAADGSVLIGTGNKGKIFKRGASGKAELFSELDDTHIRTLAVGKDGTVYAGTSDRGLVIAIAPGGAKRTLHDFGKPEVVGLCIRADGVLFAAAASAEAPGPSGQLLDSKSHAPSASAVAKDEIPKGSVSVSTSVRTSPAGKESREGATEIVSIQPDGMVEPAWLLPEDSVFSMRVDPKSQDLLLSTGPRGRVYSLKDRHLKLEAQTEQKQVVAALPAGAGLVVVTMSSPGVFRRGSKKGATSGSFVSATKDAARISQFGRVRFEGEVPAGAAVALSVRDGNSEKPDGTWSDWVVTAGDGSARVPAARYFQWKADLTANAAGESPLLELVEFSFTERNARPILENLTVLEPSAVLSRGTSSTAVFTVTNPDETGVYSGLESSHDSGDGKKLFRKGFRTITWKGSDPNGDSLRYDLVARREGSSVRFVIKRDIEDAYFSFDTFSLPDGRYRFRVTATDKMSNADGQALTAEEETGVAVVDNTAPSIKIESKVVEAGNLVIRAVATDALSAVMKAEGSVNADRWRLIPSEDGAADSLTERFTFRVTKPAKPSIVAIRVLDASGNTAAVSVEYPRDFE